MKTLLAGTLVLALVSVALSAGIQFNISSQYVMIKSQILTSIPPDASCGAGETETIVTIRAGDSFKYKTSTWSVKLSFIIISCIY